MDAEQIYNDAGDPDGYRLTFRKQEAPLREALLSKIGQDLVWLADQGIRFIVEADGSIVSSHKFKQAAIRKYALFGDTLLPNEEAGQTKLRAYGRHTETVGLPVGQTWL